jgi:CubicO group peptidase (beta-lactamase class C family)
MNDRIFPRAGAPTRKAWLALLLASAVLACTPASAGSAAQAHLPDSPAGRLAGELIHHVGADGPERIRRWAATVLSASIGSGDRAAFIDELVSAARDSGGLDVFDVRTDPRQPGLLEVAVRARRGGQRALFVLAADGAHPDRLAQAGLVPMGDPALYAHWPKGAVSHAALRKLVHAALDRLVRTQDFSGCVTVADGGRTIFDECRGLAERRFGVPVDHQTKFHIGSIDKMFTAVAIAQLVEAGKLSWDDTLASRVPEYPDQAAAKQITVWQLLHHTAGLGDFLVPGFFEHREKFVGPADYLGLIARQPKVGKPGGDWNYSSAGYVLLGRIIENASGESYFDYIQRHVFAPAQMDASGFDALDEVTPKLSVGYYHEGPFSSDWKADWMKIPFKGGPAGGGYSTNADLLRFAAALREGRLVKPVTLAKMFDGEVPAGPGGYAAGFGDRLSHGRHIRGHAGGIEGTDADLAMVWEAGVAVALTSNEGPGQSWLLAERIADLLAAEGAKP